MSEQAAETLWQEFLAGIPAGADVVRVSGPGSVVLWDVETLGSPRAALLAPDPRADPATGLAWVAEHEPHTWALVLDGRYAAGPVASYLVTRATRGLVHVTTDRAWTAVPGVPDEALPDLVAPGAVVGRTDPRLVHGLSLPISV